MSSSAAAPAAFHIAQNLLPQPVHFFLLLIYQSAVHCLFVFLANISVRFYVPQDFLSNLYLGLSSLLPRYILECNTPTQKYLSEDFHSVAYPKFGGSPPTSRTLTLFVWNPPRTFFLLTPTFLSLLSSLFSPLPLSFAVIILLKYVSLILTICFIYSFIIPCPLSLLASPSFFECHQFWPFRVQLFPFHISLHSYFFHDEDNLIRMCPYFSCCYYCSWIFPQSPTWRVQTLRNFRIFHAGSPF